MSYIRGCSSTWLERLGVPLLEPFLPASLVRPGLLMKRTWEAARGNVPTFQLKG